MILFCPAVGFDGAGDCVQKIHDAEWLLQEVGGSWFASILVGGMVVTIMPLFVGALFARKVLNMNPLMALGGMAGAQTCTPGLNALREASGSNVAALAYTVPYAIANIVLTVWGPVVVAIMHAIRS
jgi:putative transport protein